MEYVRIEQFFSYLAEINLMILHNPNQVGTGKGTTAFVRFDEEMDDAIRSDFKKDGVLMQMSSISGSMTDTNYQQMDNFNVYIKLFGAANTAEDKRVMYNNCFKVCQQIKAWMQNEYDTNMCGTWSDIIKYWNNSSVSIRQCFSHELGENFVGWEMGFQFSAVSIEHSNSYWD